MSRQPFLPSYQNKDYSIGFSVITHRPEFARLIGECIGIWSYVDNEMGTMLGLLLGSRSEATIDVFLSLRRSANQREALSTAAKHSLRTNDEAMLAFDAVMITYKSLESQRNDLAHGLFGVMPDVEDALLWIEVRHHIHFMTDVFAKEAMGVVDYDRHAILCQNLFVYKLSDIRSLHKEILDFYLAPFHFNGWIQRQGTVLGERQFQSLCEMPHIQREMSRLRSDRENTPKSPPSPP
jgi:hypothetical protein